MIIKSVETQQRGKIVKAAGVVSGATLVSRIMGFFRDMVIAQAFGAGLATDAFFVAFRIPYLFRKLLGEGSLTASFIPVFTEEREQGNAGGDRTMVASASGILLIVVCLLTFLGMIFSPDIIKLIAPGFQRSAEKFALTVSLTRMVFPYLIFISFFSLYMGVLNSAGHFFAPAAAPSFLSLAMIGSALWLAPFLENPIEALAWGVLLGGILQLLFQMPYMKTKGYLVPPRIFPIHPGVKKVCLLMLPALLGLAANEINLMVDTLLASLLPEGSISYLYYGNRLVQFPLGLIGIALGTVIFPKLSADVARMEIDKMKETMIFGLRIVLFVTLPAMVGLIVLSKPIIALLFQRGAFTIESTRFTAQALTAYSLGLWAFTGTRIIVPTFYSLKDTRTPFFITLFTITVNILLNLILMVPLKHAGLALATSISAAVNVSLLIYYLRRKIGPLGITSVLKMMVKPVMASAIMALFCILMLIYFGDTLESGVSVRLGVVFAGVALGGLIYFTVTKFMGSEELRVILEASGWSIGKDIREEDIT